MPKGFKDFADAVRAQFKVMAAEPLFVVNSDRDQIWDTYLKAFPQGSDPIFRKRTEHDCSCCRHFIRSVGNVVAVQNGALASVWDLAGLPEHYQVVADAMSEHVKGLPVRDIFLTDASTAGQPYSHGLVGSESMRFDHFSVPVPAKFIADNRDTKRGDARTTHQVLMRGFKELAPEAVSTVADLIASNAIYRGQEHKRAVDEFKRLQERFLALEGDHPQAQELLAWTLITNPVARFRNTAIGTLVQDLSEGVDLERAVKSFETKMAPANYKRPTALITKKMVDDAMKTIQHLNLEEALERRHARFTDVSVKDVLFVDNAVRGRMKGGLADKLMEEVRPPKFDKDDATEVTAEKFLDKVLPKTRALSLYLENSALSNFVSLTAPEHELPTPLFKWSNNFAWSYDGNVTDSIKERVKRAGGQVEGVALRVSLAWNNYDDLDLHVNGPRGLHIWYGDKGNPRSGRGYLDVDMNAGHGTTREPVENTRWVNMPEDGLYRISVHQYSKRESVDVGFTVEVEFEGQVHTFRHENAVPSQAKKHACDILVKNRRVHLLEPGATMIGGSLAQEKWGVYTQELVKVNSLVLSPNYWGDNATGNKHWFFILEGCKNPQPTRGIYNEFLSNSLDKHRKVFEVLGDKTKCPVADEQMSGVGFSSTRKDKVTVVAMGPSLNRTYTIVF